VLTRVNASPGVPFWMPGWQNSHQKRIDGTLSGFSLQDPSRAKRTSG
jgi:hypothetical protein